MIDLRFDHVRRSVLGLYVAVHFAMLLPFAAELFSSRGVLPAASLSPLHRFWPGLMHVSDAPAWATGIVLLGAASGVALMLGLAPRIASAAALVVWSSVFARNPLIANPSLPYVGLMLFAVALTPRDDPRLARSLERALFWAMAAGYTYSGLTKLASPSWLDGSALGYVLASPLARDAPWVTWLVASPTLTAWLTWGALALEVLFVPLSWFARMRPLLWAAMLAMHLGLLLCVDFADLTLGMLVLHLFTLRVVAPRLPRLRRASHACYLTQHGNEHAGSRAG